MTVRKNQSYGFNGTSIVDRFGMWLSQLAIRKHLPKSSGLNVVEFGCGYQATQIIALKDLIKYGVGVDFQISPEVRKLSNFEFHECSIESVFSRLLRQTFDVAMYISVLEHIEDPRAVLKAGFSLLKPGGIMLVNVPTWRGKLFLEFSAFRLGTSPMVEMDDHKMYYDKRDLWPLLVRAGFKPSHINLSYHKFGLNLFAVASKGASV